jgi:hypothetical protein
MVGREFLLLEQRCLSSIAITIFYKFSFVLVHRQGSMQVAANWVEMGLSPTPLGQCPKWVYSGFPHDGSMFNYNFRDLVSKTTNSILVTGPSWKRTKHLGCR